MIVYWSEVKDLASATDDISREYAGSSPEHADCYHNYGEGSHLSVYNSAISYHASGVACPFADVCSHWCHEEVI